MVRPQPNVPPELRAARSLGDCGAGRIASFVADGKTRYVVTDRERSEDWLGSTEMAERWHGDFSDRIARPGTYRASSSWPGEYYYTASEWLQPDGGRVFLLRLRR